MSLPTAICRLFGVSAAGVVLALWGPAWAQGDPAVQKPIVKAVRAGDNEQVRQALAKGDNANLADQGRPLLILATSAGSAAVVDTLIKAGAAVEATDNDGYTALIRAAERGDVDIVALLLKRNARPDAQNRQGVSALMFAARAGNVEIVRLLLAGKADPNLADFNGRTAMGFAHQSGRTAIELMLRKAGGRG